MYSELFVKKLNLGVGNFDCDGGGSGLVTVVVVVK